MSIAQGDEAETGLYVRPDRPICASGNEPYEINDARGTPSHRRLPVLICFNAFGGPEGQFDRWRRAATVHGFVPIVASSLDSAVAYVTQHAADLDADTARVGLIAWSGHAGVATPLVEEEGHLAIKAAVFYYGAAQVARIRLDLPVLLVRAGLDQPATNAMIDAGIVAGLTANAPWTVINYPAGHHGFDVVDTNAMSRQIIDRTFAWLRTVLSDSSRAAQRIGMAEAEAAGAAARGDYADAAARAAALDNDADAAIAWLRSIPPQFLPENVQRDSTFQRLAGRADFQALFAKP